MHADTDRHDADLRIAALAARQHGLVIRRQLVGAGVSDPSISQRVRSGRLHRVHRGVFAVGHRALSLHGRWMAAVLASGEGAVLDGRDAAQLYGIERPAWRRVRAVVCVLSPRAHRSVAGIVHRRTRSLGPRDVRLVDGIPVVSVARLLVGLAAHVSETTLVKLIDEAAYHGLLDMGELRAVHHEHRTDRGSAALAAAIERYRNGERGTDSELEEGALVWVRGLGVPDPECNVYVDVPGDDRPYRADQVWFGARVILEVDGCGHVRPTRRRADARRRRLLREAGWTVIVITDVGLRDPVVRERVGERLRRALRVAKLHHG